MLGIGGAGFTAQIRIANPPIKPPLDYWPTTLLDWLSNSGNVIAVITALAAVIGAVAAFKQLFIDKPAATREDVGTIITAATTKTDARVDEVGGQVFLADQASEERNEKLMTEIKALRTEFSDLNSRMTQIIFHLELERGKNYKNFENISINRNASNSVSIIERPSWIGFFAKLIGMNLKNFVGEDSRIKDFKLESKKMKNINNQEGQKFRRNILINDSRTEFVYWFMIANIQEFHESPKEALGSLYNALQYADNDTSKMNVHSAFGDCFFTLGIISLAQESYEKALYFGNLIVKSEPDNLIEQRNFSVLYNKLGDVIVMQGDLLMALTAYRAGLAIVERVVSQDSENPTWQRDLSVSHNKLGDLAVAQGDLNAAHVSYSASLAISRGLAAADPGNVEWQHDLSVGHERLGDVAVAAGDLPSGQQAYKASLAIRKRLVLPDPGNVTWQRDLSVSYNKLGNVAMVAGDLMAARIAYSAALAIRERLAAADPGNAEWARDLFVSHAKFAQFNETSGDIAGAIAEFEAGEAILVALIARVGDHPGFARDLANVRAEIARLRGL